jgi:DNA polymerase III subunit gamma/tau
MSYVPLHHKYRPQTFAQLVGQAAIATTLSNALEQERIAPAYLFTGARGTGKTSSARIFAKSLNCIAGDKPTANPCGTCETCVSITQGNALDVIEIDAASNTGVDNIRELIERAQFAPVQCRHKVYVIDECLTGDSLVLTQDGWQRIDDPAIKGKQVLSYNETSRQWEWKQVKRWLVRGEKPTLIIKTDRREIRCTANHLIRTAQGWLKAQDLKIGAPLLSPVSAAAVNSFVNMGQIVASADLSEVTNSKAISSAAKTTTCQPSWRRLNHFALTVNVDAVISSIFPIFCSKKAKDWWPSSLTGDVTLTAKIMNLGSNVQAILFNDRESLLTLNMGLSTALCWEMPPSPTPTDLVSFPDSVGLMDSPNNDGWNIKRADYVLSSLKSIQQKIEATVMSPLWDEPLAILNLSMFIKWLNPIIKASKSLLIGWQELLSKDWLGGTWMMAPSVSTPLVHGRSNCTPKDSPLLRTSFWRSGSPRWDIQQNHAVTNAPVAIRNFSIFPWEQIPRESGLPTYINLPSRVWNTSLEVVRSIEFGVVEPVFDIEVEDNHNFVANGLLVHNCHMLSNAAFNSLLKTLEEPPDRVVFVLATTDPQRVLPTIISRCQRFDFRRIPLDAMTAHLTEIAQTENITIAPEAVQLIGQISQGGLRDAESLLDQLSLLAGGVAVENVWDLVGAVPERDLMALAQAIFGDDAEATIDTTRKLMDRGREPLIVLQNLASFYRDLLIAKTAPDRQDLVAVTASTWEQMVAFAQSISGRALLAGQQHLRAAEVQLKNSTQPRLWLEVTLMGLLPAAIAPGEANPAPTNPVFRPANPARSAAPPAPAARPTVTPTVATPTVITAAPSAESIAPTPIPASTAPPIAPPAEPSVPAAPTHPEPGDDLAATWQEILNNLGLASTKSVIVPNCFLMEVSGNTIKIGVRGKQVVPLVKGQLEKLSKACAKTLNIKSVKMNLVVTENAPLASNAAPPNPQAGLKQPENKPAAPRPPSPPVAKTPPAANPANPKPSAPPPPASNAASPNAAPPNAAPPITTSHEAPSWTPEDPVSRAAKSLADAFNGAIVNFDQDEVEEIVPIVVEEDDPIALPDDDEPPNINVPF